MFKIDLPSEHKQPPPQPQPQIDPVTKSKITLLKSLFSNDKPSINSLSVFLSNTTLEVQPHIESLNLNANEIDKEKAIEILITCKQFQTNLSEIKNEFYTNNMENQPQCTNLYNEIQNEFNILKNYIDISKEEEDFNTKIKPLYILHTQIEHFINDNKTKEPSSKMSFNELKSNYDKFHNESKLNPHIVKLNELANEIKSIEKWLEKYNDYFQKKKKKMFSGIDLNIMETMIEDSKHFLCALNNELSILQSDYTSTNNFINIINELNLSKDIFSLTNITSLLNSNEKYKQFSQLISDLNNNKILSNDSFLINTAKSVEFCIKVVKHFTLNDNEKSKLFFNQLFKIYNEGNVLKRFNEIKKQAYIKEFIEQIQISRNFKEVADLLSKNKGKQISYDEFNKIVSQYFAIQNCKVQFKEEKDIIDSLIKSKEEYENMFDNYIKSKTNINDYEKLSNELDKFPIKLNILKDKVKDIISNTHLLQKEIKKLNELKNKKGFILTLDKVTSLQQKIRNNEAIFYEGEQLIKNYDISKDNINKLKSQIQDNNFELYEMLSLIDEITIHSPSDEKEINKVIWFKKYEELITKSKPTLSMIEHLLLEIKDYDINDIDKIKMLNELYDIANDNINQIMICDNEEALEKVKESIATKNENVDLSEFVIQQRIKVYLKKPIKGGMNYYGNKMLGLKRKKELLKDKEKEELRETRKIQSEMKGITLMDEESLAVGRSKRRIKKKVDEDYVYEKEFVEQLDNQCNQREEERMDTEELNKKAKESMIIDDDLKDIHMSSHKNPQSHTNSQHKNKNVKGDDDEYVDTYTKKEENTIHHNEDKNETYESKQLSQINAINLIKKKPTQNTQSRSTTKQSSSSDPLKNGIKKNSISQLEMLMKQNQHLLKEGNEYIANIAINLESELAKLHPKYDNEYQKLFSNMLKTIKELENYKKVCSLIKKGKITMFKMVKFPYGSKYIQNLNKIENGQLSNQDKKKENSSQAMLSIFSGMKQLYSSLHTEGSNAQPNKDKNNKDNFGDETNSYQGNNSIRGGELTQGSYDDNNDELSDDNSLKSLEDQENIRFSPNKKSPSPNNQNGHGGKTLSSRTDAINDTTEKMYDPFETLKKKHSITFPIFYDPILKKIKYYNTNHFQSSSASSWYYNNDSSSYINSSNTINLLFNGKMTILKNTLNPISMYSTEPYVSFTMLPGFNDEIVVTSKAKASEVIPYCEKQLKNKTKVVLSAWVEPTESSFDDYVNFTEDFERNDKCACLIMQTLKVYMFTLSDKYEKFNSIIRGMCNFCDEYLMRSLEKIFVCVFVVKRNDIDNLTGKKMEPKLIKKKEISLEANVMQNENDLMDES